MCTLKQASAEMGDQEIGESTNEPQENGRLSCDKRDVNEHGVQDVPSLPLVLSTALQHVLMCLPTDLAFAFVVCDTICVPSDSPVRAQVFSASLFISGICTLLQTFFGVRLPIYQGPSAAYLPTILALQSSSDWSCTNTRHNCSYHADNETNSTQTAEFTQRIQMISGSLMAASAVEALLGLFGVIGLVLRFVGPITVNVTIMMVGLSLINVPITYTRSSWPLALSGAVTAIVFSMYLRKVKVPVPRYSKGTGFHITRFRLFQVLPIILTMLVIWVIAAILTATDVFPDDCSNYNYKARTDAKDNLVTSTPWFFLPYPGRFGTPSFSLPIFAGFVTAVCASTVESVGDYLATARACDVDTPPASAVNRGIVMEGIGGVLAGSVGLGLSTTSFSQNVAVVAMSKISSRSAMLCAGLITMMLSLIGKFGAAVATIPDPAIGGVLIVVFGMLVSLGVSSLRHVNLESSRNLMVIGIALFIGLFLPQWVNSDQHFINTGNTGADQALKIIFGTPMFVGALTSVVLDNTVPGPKKKTRAKETESTGISPKSKHFWKIYSWQCLPVFYRTLPLLAKLPFMPEEQSGGVSEGYEDIELA